MLHCQIQSASPINLIYMWLNRVYGYYPAGEPAGTINYAAVTTTTASTTTN
jgi:hypothetical protein